MSTLKRELKFKTINTAPSTPKRQCCAHLIEHVRVLRFNRLFNFDSVPKYGFKVNFKEAPISMAFPSQRKIKTQVKHFSMKQKSNPLRICF